MTQETETKLREVMDLQWTGIPIGMAEDHKDIPKLSFIKLSQLAIH